MNISENFGLLSSKIDAVVKSLFNLSFRVKREIFPMQHAEYTSNLPNIRMTDSPNLTFCETIKICISNGVKGPIVLAMARRRVRYTAILVLFLLLPISHIRLQSTRLMPCIFRGF